MNARLLVGLLVGALLAGFGVGTCAVRRYQNARDRAWQQTTDSIMAVNQVLEEQIAASAMRLMRLASDSAQRAARLRDLEGRQVTATAAVRLATRRAAQLEASIRADTATLLPRAEAIAALDAQAAALAARDTALALQAAETEHWRAQAAIAWQAKAELQTQVDLLTRQRNALARQVAAAPTARATCRVLGIGCRTVVEVAAGAGLIYLAARR